MSLSFIHIPKNGGTSIMKTILNIPSIKYCNHSVDVHTMNKKDKTIIIIRDPIDRFCSAIRYTIQQYSHEPPIQKLINLGITTPNKFAEILSDSSHKYYSYILDEICNKSHHIGNNKLFFKWTYSPQNLWINTPTYVILFENLNIELTKLLKSLGHTNIKLEHCNKTIKTNHEYLSPTSIQFLMEFYKTDIELYDKYSAMSQKQRLHL